MSKVKEAFLLAKRIHKGTFRRTGEPYYYHVSRVAKYAYLLHPKEETLVVAYLHDVLEESSKDRELISEEIKEKFGPSVWEKVIALTFLGDDYSQYVVNLASDPITLAVKLADIYDNLSTSPLQSSYEKYLSALRALLREISSCFSSMKKC